jgi:ATP-binding cassette, subfamily C, bacterial
MSVASTEPGMATPLASSLRLFIRDFAAFAGRKGIAAALLIACGGLLEVFGLVLLVPLVSLAIGSDLPSGKLGRAAAALFHFFDVETALGRLALLLGIFGVLIILRAVLVSARDVTVAELQTGFVEALRLRITQCLVAAQWDQVVRLRHARIAHLVSGDIQRIGGMMQVFLRCVVTCAMLLAQCALVLVLAPAFAALALGLLAVGAVAFWPAVRRARAFGGIVSDANLSLLDSTTQFLGGLKLAMSQNLQARFIDEFRQSLHELTRRQIDYVRQQTRVRVMLTTLPALVAGLLVWLGFAVFHLTAATLIALIVIIARMIAPVGQVQQGVQQLAQALPAYEKAKELEAELDNIPQRRHLQTAAPPLPEGAIVVENIRFRHAAADDGGSVRGIVGVSLTLQPGEMIGVTGPSGAGKTTFADILVGLFPPQHGRIRVAGTTLDGAALESWRDQVSYVSQDPFLFHDTVRRNLIWANPQSSENAIWEALALAGADSLVRAMPLRLDTVVGERGTLVSGGERQRIAIARAILRKPRLLVLDEATAAIDVDGERSIFERLRQLRPRPTIVIIAHRAESLTLCERILRFEAGHCFEEDALERGSDYVAISP